MKKALVMATLGAALSGSALADFSVDFNSGFANSGNIPDGSTIGMSDTRNLTGIPFNTISDVQVRLNISGGFNGDLYAYLVHSSGFAVLLNRVGVSSSSAFGYGDGGMNITFSSGALQSTDIHNYQAAVGYNPFMLTGGTPWRPDGRNISPLSSGATFDATVPTALLTSFNGINPNGNWTLALFDVSAGGGQATLNGWGLTIDGLTAVPEPASIIEGSIAALGIALFVVLYRVRQGRLVPVPAC